MSVHYDAGRARWVVHWREEGRQRKRRFDTEGEAQAFDLGRDRRTAARSSLAPSSKFESRGDGIYAYSTTQGPRWRFVFRQSDGQLSSRRGFISRRAAAAARRTMVESITRGEVKVARESFADFWVAVCGDKRRYITSGSHQDFVNQDFVNHGRKRLLPFFGDTRLSAIDEAMVRKWLGTMAVLVETGALAPKTVNNARTCLSVALREATRRGLLARNPCDAAKQLPTDRKELDYLRLPEIPAYLDAASARYRPLAEFLIGTGTRISEALAVRPGDLALTDGVVRVYRQQAATKSGTAPTKGKRFRSVQIGPGLAATLEVLTSGKRTLPVCLSLSDSGSRALLEPHHARPT